MRHEMKLLVLQKLKFQNFTQPVFLLEYLYLNKTLHFSFRARRKKEKTSLMTMLYRVANPGHFSR